MEDVKNATPNEIVKKYDMYVLDDICLGLRLRGIYRTSVPAAIYSAKKITLHNALWEIAKAGFSTGIIIDRNDDEIAQSIGGQLLIEFYGGDTLLLNDDPQKGYTNWLSSANEKNYVLTKISRKATPIYELITDATKREQIRAAVQQYIANHEIKMVQTTPLLQSWNGINHTYHNSYKTAYIGYEGPVCSMFQEEGEQRVPLYCYSNGKNHYLTLQKDGVNLGDEWQLQNILGYVYNHPVERSIPLYECKNKYDYCYTTENKESYGTKGDWKKVKMVCYVLPL